MILGERKFILFAYEDNTPAQGEIITKHYKFTKKIQNSLCPEPAGQIQSNLVQIILG
jgi:hypothetical protein